MLFIAFPPQIAITVNVSTCQSQSVLCIVTSVCLIKLLGTFLKKHFTEKHIEEDIHKISQSASDSDRTDVQTKSRPCFIVHHTRR